LIKDFNAQDRDLLDVIKRRLSPNSPVAPERGRVLALRADQPFSNEPADEPDSLWQEP
jgi:hypothetical protein